MTSLKSWLAFFFLIALQSPAHAQFFIGPAASGAGGGGRAAVDQGESSFLNPASVAFLQTYNASAYYGSGQHPAEGSYSLLGASLADGSSEAAVPGALTFIRKQVDAAGGVSDTQQDIQISVAGIVLPHLAVGIAGHRLTDQILSNFAGSEYAQNNMHIGALYAPTPALGFGFVAYDVLPIQDAIPVGIHLVPTLAAGVNFASEKTFRMRLDLIRPDTQNDGHRINVAAGLETFFTESFLFRLGGFWRETADQTYTTVGLGYQGPKLSFNYSFQKDVRAGDNNRHFVDLWLPL